MLFSYFTVPPPLEFVGKYGELKFVNGGESVDKSPASVAPTPVSSDDGSKSSGGKASEKSAGGFAWDEGKASPPAPSASPTHLPPSPDRVAVFS